MQTQKKHTSHQNAASLLGGLTDLQLPLDLSLGLLPEAHLSHMVALHHVGEAASQVGQLQGGGAELWMVGREGRRKVGVCVEGGVAVTPGYCGFAAAPRLGPRHEGGRVSARLGDIIRAMRRQEDSLPQGTGDSKRFHSPCRWALTASASLLVSEFKVSSSSLAADNISTTSASC